LSDFLFIKFIDGRLKYSENINRADYFTYLQMAVSDISIKIVKEDDCLFAYYEVFNSLYIDIIIKDIFCFKKLKSIMSDEFIEIEKKFEIFNKIKEHLKDKVEFLI
jgi:hypothetical protein